MAVVYRVTNTINQKIYVGVTRRGIAVRKREHLYQSRSGSRTPFHSAIRKYGEDVFEWVILEDGIRDADLPARECYWIDHFGCVVETGRGYNRTLGGGGVVGMEVKQSTRVKQSKASSERWFKKYGYQKQKSLFHNRTAVPVTDETRRKMSESSKLTPLGTVPAKLHHSLWPMIRSLREFGFSYRRLGEIYEVRPETVFYFCRRREARPS